MTDFAYQGYGANATGGEGGTTYTVTNETDLKTRLEQAGAKIVQFTGQIEVTSQIDISADTTFRAVPGKWAEIKSGSALTVPPIRIQTNNHIIERIAFRAGDTTANTAQDSLQINGGTNVMVNRCSLMWAADENVSCTNSASNVTFQWCIIAEPLVDPYAAGSNGLGMLLGSSSTNISVHHCLFVNNAGRNPRIAIVGPVELICNTIFNPGDHPTTTAGNAEIDLVKCHYIRGTDSNRDWIIQHDATDTIFYTGNTCSGCGTFVAVETDPGSAGSRQASPPVAITEEATAQLAHEAVLANAGTGDMTDQRVIKTVVDETSNYIDFPSDVGGYIDITNTLGFKVISLQTSVASPEYQLAIVEFYEEGNLVHTDSFDFILDTTDRWLSFRAMIDRFVANNSALLTGSATDNRDTDHSLDTDDPNGWLADKGMISFQTDGLIQVS